MHNFDQVDRLGVRVGDTIVVEKAGEIIPQVVSVVFEKRPKDAVPIEPPRKCPDCQKPTERDPGGAYLRCINPDCPAQLRERLIYFAGRGQMDIEGLGPALIDQLLGTGTVHHLADLYGLTTHQLACLEHMGDKSAHNVHKAIAESKSRGLARLVTAIGIRHVGGSAAEVLAGHFGDLDRLAAASLEELTEVNEIGPVIAASLRQFFDSPAGRETIVRLKAVGIKTTEDRRAAASEGPLAGATVVLTGTMETLTRPQATELITKAGGRVVSSVSASTSFVVVGADPGSKAQKAGELGVEMIDEAEFLRRVKLVR